MMSQMKVIRVIVTAGVISSFCTSLRAQLVDGIIAIVDKSAVTRLELAGYAAPFIEQLKRQYGDEPTVLENQVSRIENEGMEALIQRQLILHDYKTGGYSIPETYLDDVVEERIRKTFGNRAKAAKTLQAEGKTFEKLREEIRDQIIIEALRSKHVSSEIIISPHKIETYYLAHQDQFKVEDEVKLRMIVLNKANGTDAASVRERAEEIRTKIKEGVPFSEMEQVNSESPQRARGSEWYDRKALRKELSDVAFAMKPGELSDVIETSDACFLILVEEKRPAHVKPLRDVQQEIEQTMLRQEQSRLQKQYVNRLRKKTFVRYF
jgi:parvulin-like peptidyl-prolyl isomerase